MTDDNEKKGLITKGNRELAELLDDAPVAYGRKAKTLQSTDLAPAINKTPANWLERKVSFEAKKREGYSVRLDEQVEFATFDGAGDHSFDPETGEIDYGDDAAPAEQSPFGNQW